jgi:RND family efflux transporter MFP subunit
LTSRRDRLWKALRWLLLAGSLVSVALVLSPGLVGMPRTNTGVGIDPALTDTSYLIAPGATSELVPEQELAAFEPATPPGDEVLQPSGSRSEAWFGLTASGALDCVIDPYQLIEVGSSVTGIVEAVLVERSERVNAGDVLVELDSGVERAAVELARARAGMDGEIKAREANLELGKLRRERANNLFQQEALSLDLRQEIDTEATIARLELQRARESQRLARLQLAQAEEVLKRRSIRSPVDGVVIERLMSPGERVDEETLLTIAQIDPLVVEVILPSAMFGSVRLNMRAAVEPELGDQVHVGAVTIVDQIIDAASGTFGVQLELPNPDHAIPAGLHCQVRFLAD